MKSIDDHLYPYYPFKIEKADGSEKYFIKNHLMDKAIALNKHSAEILRYFNGEDSLASIITRITENYNASSNFNGVREQVMPLLEVLTENELLWWRKTPTEIFPVEPPPSVFWEITSRCNLRCLHCVVAGGEKLKNEMSTTRCLQLAKEMAEYGVGGIAFSGGEPFLHPDFTTIVEHAKQLGLNIQVATNGTLITKERADWLNEMDAEVQVSLDGSSSKIHDHLRPGHKAFDYTINGIKNLVKAGHKITIGTVLSAINYDDIMNIISLGETLGVSVFRLIPFVPKGRGAEYNQLEVPPIKVKAITEKLKKLRNEIPIEISHLEFEDMIDAKLCDNSSMGNKQSLGCSGAVGYATISPTGELLPCHFFEGVRADSLIDNEFSEVWRKSRFLNYFRNLNVTDLHGACKQCNWLDQCGGSCRATNYAKGDIFGPNISCWIAEELRG